jgi:hypothetical protein
MRFEPKSTPSRRPDRGKGVLDTRE